MPAAAIAANLAEVRARIARAAAAVSKTFGLDAIRAAIDAGQRDFGENKVQEALPKIEAIAASHPDVRWHLIGHLQSNKARKAARPFDAIHSIDSLDLLRRIDDAPPRAAAGPTSSSRSISPARPRSSARRPSRRAPSCRPRPT
jgi:uncharacterized pyridoxal phosphate-containing UPF0001 family protein